MLSTCHMSFAGTEGDPVLLHDKKESASLLPCGSKLACGAQGLGGYKSLTPSNPLRYSWTHFCVFSESSASTGSLAMRITTQPLPSSGECIFPGTTLVLHALVPCSSVRSTDGGVTWSTVWYRFPLALTSSATCRSLATRSRAMLYIAGMNEFNGGLTNRANKMHRSTDGGVTWTNTYTGPAFAGFYQSASGFLAHRALEPPYWRHQGLG